MSLHIQNSELRMFPALSAHCESGFLPHTLTLFMLESKYIMNEARWPFYIGTDYMYWDMYICNFKLSVDKIIYYDVLRT
jgi:hypothetical protein